MLQKMIEYDEKQFPQVKAAIAKLQETESKLHEWAVKFGYAEPKKKCRKKA